MRRKHHGKTKYLHCVAAQRSQGKQYCRATPHRYVVHEVIYTARRGCSCWFLMMYHSGFNREDEWGFRAMEPSRCCISSIALVLLKTGIVHHPPAPSADHPVTIDYNQMATAQKLLLFWRKPAVGLTSRLFLFYSRYRSYSASVGGTEWRWIWYNLAKSPSW